MNFKRIFTITFALMVFNAIMNRINDTTGAMAGKSPAYMIGFVLGSIIPMFIIAIIIDWVIRKMQNSPKK